MSHPVRKLKDGGIYLEDGRRMKVTRGELGGQKYWRIAPVADPGDSRHLSQARRAKLVEEPRS